MNVLRIQILEGDYGPDKVVLYLEAETPFPALGYPPTATLEAAHGEGLTWATKHFPDLIPEVIRHRRL